MALRTPIDDPILDDPTPTTSPQLSTYNVDDIPELGAIPDEINDEGQGHNHYTTAEATIDLESLRGLGFNHKQDELERAKMTPPRGDWEKEEPFTFEVSFNEADSAPGDCFPTRGRVYYKFAGYPKPRVVNGLSYRPMLFLRISPDKRQKQDDPTKTDKSYQLFLEAKDLYLAQKGESASDQAQLITLLVEHSYLVNTMNGDNGVVVLHVKDKRQPRR